MRNKYLYVLIAFLFTGSIFAQTTETFETETNDSTSFTDNSQVFNVTSQAGGTFDIANYISNGWNGTSVDNKFIDNSATADIGVPVTFTIKSAGASPFFLKSVCLFLSQSDLNPGIGSCTITGKKAGSIVFTATSSAGFNSNILVNNGYTFIDLTSYGDTDNSSTSIDEYIITTTGTFEYVALDAMKWEYDCSELVAPTASAQNFCDSATIANLIATGNSLKWYADASGGSALTGTTALTTKTYYVTSSSIGCESARIPVSITITPSSDNVTVVSACDSYTWNGTTYTTSGIKTGPTANCVTEKLDLTINATPVPNAISNQVYCSNQVTNPIIANKICGTANEGQNIQLIAPTGFVFSSVPFASYGTPNGICNNFTLGSCHAANSISIVEAIVLGQNSATISALNSVFGDPCGGTVKRLYVEAAYGTVSSWTNNTPSIGLAASGAGTIPSFTAVNSTSSPIVATITVIFNNGTCDSAPQTFTITINPITTNTTTVSACDSYVWSENGNTYTTSGNYTIVNGCHTENLALTINSTPAPTAPAQIFCGTATVADLAATGTALQWYDVASDGTGLASNTILASGTYYVSQTIGTCESTRTAVAVTVGTTTTWTGSWDNGAPTSTSKAIIASDFTATGDLTACSLEVTGTAIVSVPTGFNFNISGKVTVAPTASLTFENNANLVQIEAVANAGNITVKRNSSPLIRQDYTLWSSPVSGQELLAFSPATLTNRFNVYNPTTNFYNAITPTVDFNMGTGYLIRMPNTHPATPTIWNGSFTGVPNNGDILVTMTDGGSGFRFNLTGNPYPSPINMAQFIADNSTITGTLYFWRKTNNPLSPSYCSWVGGTFITNGEAQVVDPNGIIQTGQGFFVEANGTGTALTFKNTQRIGNTAGQFFKTKAVEKNRIWLNATNTTGAFSQMAVGYITGATQGVDAFDGKYFNDGVIALSSILDDTDYAIQGRAMPFDGTDVVPLHFSATTAGDYTIAIDHVDGLFSENQDIILKDNSTGTETNLKNGAYTFAATAGSDKNRFELKYQKTLGIDANDFNANSILVYKNKGVIQIKSSDAAIAKVKIFDIQGRLLFEKLKVNAKETSIESANFANQVLVVEITSDDNKKQIKKVVN